MFTVLLYNLKVTYSPSSLCPADCIRPNKSRLTLTDVHFCTASEGNASPAEGRIHMVAGEPVGVLYNTLFANVHKDGLTTHSTDVVREVLGWHPGRAVILRETNKHIKNRNAKGCKESAGVCLPQQ